MKVKKGISLIVLIVTIIVMIIIAGAIIISLSNTNIIDQADKAKTKWDIASIKEQLTIHNALAKTGTNAEVKNGTLKDIGIDDESWNEKVIIRDGKLVYMPENLTDAEEQALVDAGIECSEHISIVNASTKTSKYANDENVVTPDGLFEKLAWNSEDTEKEIYILEDLESWGKEFFDRGVDFYAILDGLGHTVTGLEASMFYYNYGTIRNITITGNYDVSELGEWGIVNVNNGLIEYCHNKANIYGDALYVGGIAAENDGVIYRCSNTGQVSGVESVGGIAGFNRDSGYQNEREYQGAQIIECFNSGKVGAWDESGNKILDVTAKGVGGIIGYNEGIALFENPQGGCINCYNVGEIAGSEYVAGISGHTYTDITREYTIKNSYNAGDVSGSSNCGAIASAVDNRGLNVINTFSIKISGLELIGGDGANLTNVDWINNLVNDGETETQADRDKLLEMLNAGNSEEIWVNDTNNINNGYPILKWQVTK